MKAWLALLVLMGVSMTSAATDPPPPADLHSRVRFEQLLGAQIPMDTQFADAHGKRVTLSELVDGKPLLLAMGYYQCPNLCDAMLISIAQAVSRTRLEVGRDFAMIFVGIDPAETAIEAQQARDDLQRRVPNAAVNSWQLMLGDESSIRNLAHAVGYRYIYDSRLKQYIHPSGIVVAGGDGVISQYLFGVGYSPESLRLALVEASAGRVGNIVDQLVLLCSGYDPQNGRYSIVISKVLRLLAIVTTIFLAAFLFYLQLQPRRGG